MTVETIDFSCSYLRFRIDPKVQPAITVTRPLPTKVLNVRITAECRCQLTNRVTGETRTYVLGSSCKTELVGAARDIWMEPNADFCLVMSESEFLVIKSWARREMPHSRHPDAPGIPLERQSGASSVAWTEYSTKWQSCSGRLVQSIDDIIASIRSNRQLVARTEYAEGDWQVIIEHPVKTINYSEEDDVFQTDTGPVLLPDLSVDRLKRSERLIECFDLAYAAFNSAGWAEFIVNVPTVIADGIRVNHYSLPRRIEPTRNSLIELTEEVHLPMRQIGEHFPRPVVGAAPKNGSHFIDVRTFGTAIESDGN